MMLPNILIALFGNAVLFALLCADAAGLNLYLRTVLVTLAMYVVPGMAWMGCLHRHVSGSVFYLFFQFVFSVLGMILVHAAFLATGHVPGPDGFVLGLLVVTNLGIVVTRPGRALTAVGFDARRVVILAMSLVSIYSCLFAGMRHLPGQLDLDGEHQGTAYGIIHEFKPYLTSDIIASPYYFAHPTLSNFFNAYSTLLLGNLEDYRYFYDTAKETERMLALKPGAEIPTVIGEDRGTLLRMRGDIYIFKMFWRQHLVDRPFSRQRLIEFVSMHDQNRFFDDPRPFPARASNIFAGLLAVCLLFQWITQLTNSRLLGIVSGFVYIFSPGIFIRSCFSEHVAFTNMVLILLAYQATFPRAFEGQGRAGRWLAYVPGVVAGLINQKVIIMVLPLFLLQAVECLRRKEAGSLLGRMLREMTIPVGFAVGTLLFWAYGLAIDPEAFFVSHLRVHLFDRLLHLNTMFAEDYPTLGYLWYQFNYEFPAFLLCVFAMLYSWKNSLNRNVVFLSLWAAGGALLFSLVDWKQTNHLTQLTIPLLGILMMYIEQQPLMYKRALKVLVGLSLLFGFWFDMQLLASFQFYQPVSGW